MKRLTRSFAVLAVLALLGAVPDSSRAGTPLSGGSVVEFASASQGQRILWGRDEFVERMSPFDRAARLKTDREVSEQQYLEFVAQNVLDWEQAEVQKLDAALGVIAQRLKENPLPFPKKIFLIKTTGKEEGGAAYTRANAIVLPRGDLVASGARLQKTLCHELFHILSRSNPELRERFYAAIGFLPCDEPVLPAPLRARQITNPDAPRNDHRIRVRVDGEDRWAVPVLLSRAKKYDTRRGGEFFDYLLLRFALLERPEGTPELVALGQLSGFFEQVGRNTSYIIHPEEILADNFALLVLGRESVPSPAVAQKLEAILNNPDGAE